MQLPLRSLLLAAGAGRLALAFAPSLQPRLLPAAPLVAPLRAADTDVEALLAKVRALRESAQASEDALQSDAIRKKQEKNDATDRIIEQLFPVSGEEDTTTALVDRLRAKRLASGMLVQVVERIHAREVSAQGLEHIEARAGEKVKFERVAKEDPEELARVRGLVDRLTVAAEVLDKELLKAKANEKMTNADMMHWGGGNLAQLLRDKARDLGREYDEQFRKRQQEFFDAAVRNPDLSAGDFHEYSWQDSWKGVEDMKGKKKDKKDKSKKK